VVVEKSWKNSFVRLSSYEMLGKKVGEMEGNGLSFIQPSSSAIHGPRLKNMAVRHGITSHPIAHPHSLEGQDLLEPTNLTPTVRQDACDCALPNFVPTFPGQATTTQNPSPRNLNRTFFLGTTSSTRKDVASHRNDACSLQVKKERESVGQASAALLCLFFFRLTT
jgi:hypothetical protein